MIKRICGILILLCAVILAIWYYYARVTPKEYLNEDFYISYVDIEYNKDIYYDSQGILGNDIIQRLDYNDSLILIMVKTTSSNPLIKWYCIDVNKYKKDPIQRESRGFRELSNKDYINLKSYMKNRNTKLFDAGRVSE